MGNIYRDGKYKLRFTPNLDKTTSCQLAKYTTMR